MMIYPTQKVRYLAQFNPPVPARIRHSETAAPLYPMDAIHEFGEPSAPQLRSTSELLTGYSYLETTDVAYAKVTPCFENGKGLVGQNLPGPSFATSELTVLRPNEKTDQKFLSYLVRSDNFRNSAISSMTGAGGLKRVSESHVANMQVPAPPTDLQRTIADYLDHETAEIDALIGDFAEAQTISKERWQSNLVRAIQTGISKNKMRETDITTWPFAPDHWAQTRLKSTVRSSNNGAWGNEPGDAEITIRCVRVADFNKALGVVTDLNPTERSFPRETLENLKLQSGNLVLEKSGGGPTTPVGNVVIYESDAPAMYSNFVARIELKEAIHPRYALYLNQSIYAVGATQRSIKQSTGIQNLDSAAYFNEPIFLPEFIEQVEIAEYLELQRESLDTLIADFTRAIALAKEHRAALITAAVTGQIDVTQKHRPAAEQLEDDIKELS